MKIPLAVLAAALLMAISAHATDVHEVLAGPRQRMESADYRATGRLVRVDAAGARTSYGITIKARWFPGVLRVLCEVSSPANARVHLLLEMQPNGQKSIRVAHPSDTAPTTLPLDKWGDDLLGSGFSYEDFLEPQYYWQGQAILQRTRFGARDCDVLKSTPGATDRTHYAEVRTWLDHAIGYPVYAEKTQRGTGTVKEFTYIGLRQTGGVWSASQVEVKVRGRAGSTFLIVDRGSAKANLKLRDFSPEQVSHF